MDSSDAMPASELPEHQTESPLIDDAIEITDADLVADEPAVPLFDGIFSRPGILISFLWCLLLVVVQLAVGIALVVVSMVGIMAQQQGQPDHEKLTRDVEQAAQAWMLPLASLSTVVLAFIVTTALFRGQIFRVTGFRRISPAHVVLILMLAVPMTVLTSEFTNWVQYLFPKMQMLEIFADFAKQPLVLIFLAGCFFPGLGEELFFRGFLSRGLIFRYGPSVGTLMASFLFGLIHIHPVQASGAFMLGLVLQFVFLATQSLWGAIVLHTANNALAFGAMIYGDRLPIPGFTAGAKDVIMHTPVLLVLAAMLSVATLLFVLYRTRAKWLQPEGTTWSRGFVTAEGPSNPSVTVVPGSFRAQDIAGVVVSYGIFVAVLLSSVTA